MLPVLASRGYERERARAPATSMSVEAIPGAHGRGAVAAPPPDFLVIGMQKSGTHWITAMLNFHPQIRCFPSLPQQVGGDGSPPARFFHVLARLDSDYASFRRSMRRILKGAFADLVPEDEPATEAGRQELRLRLRDRFSAYCDEQRSLHGKPLVGEKTAETVHHIGLVDRLFPGIKKVCILRDPRDRVVSYHHQQILKGRREERAINAEDVDAYLEKYLRKDYRGLLDVGEPFFLLSYEQLHEDPVPVVEGLLRFLGAATGEAPELARGASFERLSGRRPSEEDRGSYYRKGVVGDWRGQLDPSLSTRLIEGLDDLTREVESRHGFDLSAYRSPGL